MTLGVLVATSSGIVICTDSLVTTSQSHRILKDPRQRIDLPKEIWDVVNDGKFGYATQQSNITTKESIISTSPNVKKMFQIGDHAIAFTMAGENHWAYTQFDKDGFNRNDFVPLESYVDTVVTDVIGSLDEESEFEDIIRCLVFVLNFGQLINNDEYRENGKNSIYSIIGGGFGKNDSYPRAFQYQMPGGRNRQSVLDACNQTFGSALADTFIQSCYSTNWFDEYCQEDLICAVDLTHAQAWVWGEYYGWSAESITEQLIPHVNENIIDALVILNEITSDDPHSFLQVNRLSTPYILSKFWNKFNKSNTRKPIEKIVSQINNVSPRMLDLIQNDNVRANVKQFKDSIHEYVFGLYPKTYENQSDKIKKSITYEGFNAMWCILETILPTCMLSLSNTRGNIRAEEIIFSPTMWTGLDFIGNCEVVEKITKGMDSETRYGISDDIRSYQMHAAERLATIISHKISGEEPPQYLKYGENPVDEKNDGTDVKQDEKIHSPTEDCQTVLPLVSSDEDYDTSMKYDLSGIWKGFHTITDDSNDGSEKFEFELEIKQLDYNSFSGESLPTSPSQLTMNNGKIVFDNIIQFDLIIDGNDLAKIQVDGEVKAWGIEGYFELDGNRENFIIHRKESTSAIDSEKLTSEALNQLVMELETLYPNYKSWEVNYSSLPLRSAVKMAQYLMNSTVMKQRFNLELPSVGGPIRTLVITRDKGLKILDDYTI